MKTPGFGLKLWSSNYGLAPAAKKLINEGVFDYVELMVVPGTKKAPFRQISVPMIVHGTSEKWGFNLADASKEKQNRDIIENCLDWAASLNAEYVILHPGYGDFQIAQEFLEKINDNRILIENMPRVGIDGEKMVGYSLEQIKGLCQGKFGFCLDFNHAAKAALSLGKDYKAFIDGLAELEPKVMHVSDGNLRKEVDEHLAIGAGDFDFSFLAEIIAKGGVGRVSMETPRTDMESLAEDVENLRKLKLRTG